MGEEAEKVQAQNDEIIAERGPGLYYDIKSYILVKDTSRGMVMLGGLGGLGRGRMWRVTSESDKESSSYDEAPEMPGLEDDFGMTSEQAATGQRPSWRTS